MTVTSEKETRGIRIEVHGAYRYLSISVSLSVAPVGSEYTLPGMLSISEALIDPLCKPC